MDLQTQTVSRAALFGSPSPSASPEPEHQIPLPFEYEFDYEPITASPQDTTLPDAAAPNSSPEPEEAFSLFSNAPPLRLTVRSPTPEADPWDEFAKNQKRPDGWHLHSPLSPAELAIAVDGTTILSAPPMGWAPRFAKRVTTARLAPALAKQMGMEIKKEMEKSGRRKPGKKRRVAIRERERKRVREEEERRRREEEVREKRKVGNKNRKGKRRENAKLKKMAEKGVVGGEGVAAAAAAGGDVEMKE